MNVAKTTIRIVLLCIVLAASACRSAPEPTPVPAPTATEVPTATSVPMPTLAPTATVEPTAQAPPVELVPYASQGFAWQGLVPQGWREPQPGTFARLASPSDQAVIIVASYANAPQEWLRYYLTRALPILDFPPSAGSRQSPTLNWSLYSFEGQNRDGFAIGFDLAVARTGAAFHAIALQSPLQ